jgi:hypothetical protein
VVGGRKDVSMSEKGTMNIGLEMLCKDLEDEI